MSVDPQLMRAPHPTRCGVVQAEFVPMLEEHFGAHTWNTLVRRLRDDALMTGVAVGEMCAQPEHHRLAQFVRQTSGMSGGTELGNAYAAMLMLRHHLSPQPFFVIQESLIELLGATDLADDVPVSVLQLPFPRCYLEFGKSRTVEQRLPNIESGLHILEGAYCEYGVHPEYGPSIYVMLTGSPLGKAHVMDDATHAVFLPLGDGTNSLRSALEWSFARSQELARSVGLRESPESFLEQALECLLLWAKVVLYIGLPEARKQVHKDRTELEAQLRAKKSGGKRAKLERKLTLAVDYVEVSAPPLVSEVPHSTAPSGRTVKVHWRRGHYRMQAHGPQLSLRKLIFISPVLINASDMTAPAATYRVS